MSKKQKKIDQPDINDNKSDERTIHSMAENTSQPESTNSGIYENTIHPEATNIEYSEKSSYSLLGDNNISVSPESIYILNGASYKYVKPLSTEKTGEADVLLVTKEKQQFALKLYYPNYTPKNEVMQVLKSLSRSGFTIPLLDYGQWVSSSQPNVTQFFSLMSYMAYDTLDHIKLNKDEDLLRKIAINAAACISLCHKKHVLHKDIKPSNFYFTDNTQTSILLADFGISSIIDENGFSYSRQSGTTTYNAPEMYNVSGNKVRLTNKSDFYSLGIMLISLWMGEAQFRIEMGDKTGKNRIFDLFEKKSKSNLPYPTDLSENLLTLIKGLTVADETKRWGSEEFKRWANGKLLQIDLNAYVRTNIPFMFDETKGLVAYTPQELAGFMYDAIETAIKYLRHGNISKWLYECNRNKMATELDEIIKTYTDDYGCTYMSIFLLSPTRPYQGIQGDVCTTDKDISQDVFTYFSDYTIELTNPNAKLFCYLRSHGRGTLCDKYKDKFAINPSDSLLEFIFAIATDQPYPLIFADGNIVEYNNPEEIVKSLNKRINTITDGELLAFVSNSFLVWLENHDSKICKNALAQKEGFTDNKDKPFWAVVYNLDLHRSYELSLSSDEGPCHMSIEEIAELINEKAIQYYCINRKNPQTEEDKKTANFINDLQHFNGTRLYFYLKAKGRFDKQIEWINYCYEINSKENTDKPGPYNETIAIFKTIKGLMGKDNTPAYYFPKVDKTIHSLNELKSIDPETLREELRNGYLSDWITIFFQENPYAEMKENNDFEKLTDQYVSFLQKLSINYNIVKKYNFAKNIIRDRSGQIEKSLDRIHILHIAIAFCVIAPLLITIIDLAFFNLPFIGNPLPNISYTIFGGTTILLSFLILFTTSIGFFLSLILGAAISFITYYLLFILFSFFLPFANWGIIVLIGLLIYYFIKSCIINNKINNKVITKIKSIGEDFETKISEPLIYTFNTPNGTEFISTFITKTNKFYLRIKDMFIHLVRSFIIGIIIAITFIVFAIYVNPQIGPTIGIRFSELKGEWNGTYDGHPANMVFYTAEQNMVRASIYVEYKKPVSQLFTGNYSRQSKTLILQDEDPGNGILDGDFSGEFTNYGTTFIGKFRAFKTGKANDFVFKRKANFIKYYLNKDALEGFFQNLRLSNLKE